MTTNLTSTQRLVLERAADLPDGRVTWFPDNVKGGARGKVLDGLLHRALIGFDGTDYVVTRSAYEALGRTRPTPAINPPGCEDEAAVAASEAAWVQDTPESAQPTVKPHVQAKPRTRENSKQASVIQLLQRQEGATIGQIMEATGWNAHTIRGSFAGCFKKKLGLTLMSEKPEGGERTYRICPSGVSAC